MLTLKVHVPEKFDERSNEFVNQESFELDLEHSLVSMSKWESRFERPFLNTEKTLDETLWYIRAMTMSPDVSPEVYDKITPDQIAEINLYVGARMTATTFHEETRPRRNGEVITSEIIYYWMVALNIDWEAQWWHLNRLLTLIRVINLKNKPAKKINKTEAAQKRRELNAQRRAATGSPG